MSEVLDTGCHVWDVDSQTPDHDDCFPCATFVIDIQAIFTRAVAYDGDNGDEEEDEPCFVVPETETVVVEKTHQVGVEQLMDNNSSLRVRDMLVSMDVPVQDFMVEQILACAQRMGMTEKYRNRKVLRMRVEIEAVVNELPEEEENEEENEDSDSMMMNDNESAIEKLRKVVVERQNRSCPICLEDFLVGTEATSIPACSHVFHAACIIPWLYKKMLCPLCRAAFK